MCRDQQQMQSYINYLKKQNLFGELMIKTNFADRWNIADYLWQKDSFSHSANKWTIFADDENTLYIIRACAREGRVKPAESLVKKNKNHKNPFGLMLCLHVEPLMKCHCDFPCVAHTCVLGSLTNHTDKITMPLHHPKGSSINPKAINRNKLISGCRCN